MTAMPMFKGKLSACGMPTRMGDALPHLRDWQCHGQAEAEAAQSAARLVAECALELWPHCQVLPFGSQATTMALPGSDVDIAILGVGQPAAKGATGFSKWASPG